MARESVAAGDRIAAEDFYQHAEHYLRLMNEFKSIAVSVPSPGKDELSQEDIYPMDKDATLAAAHTVVARTQLVPEAEGL